MRDILDEKTVVYVSGPTEMQEKSRFQYWQSSWLSVLRAPDSGKGLWAPVRPFLYRSLSIMGVGSPR
jgi:hypothetical protein